MVAWDWMPYQSTRFRVEFVQRHASVPYFAGRGGVTSPAGLITTPLDPNGSWRPDLVQKERKLIFVVLFRI